MRRARRILSTAARADRLGSLGVRGAAGCVARAGSSDRDANATGMDGCFRANAEGLDIWHSKLRNLLFGLVASLGLLVATATLAGCGSDAVSSVSGGQSSWTTSRRRSPSTPSWPSKAPTGAVYPADGAWAIALNGYKAHRGEAALTVVAADSGCTLSITEVKAGTTAAPLSFKPAAPFPLTAAFATNGVAMMTNGTGVTQFYANFPRAARPRVQRQFPWCRWSTRTTSARPT